MIRIEYLMSRIYATQNEKGDGVRLSLLDIACENADCKTIEDVGKFLHDMEKKWHIETKSFIASSSLNWPRDHPDCTDGCVALCNALTGNTVE